MLVLTEPTSSGCAVAAVAEHGAERLDLDGIAERGAGAVGLDVADVVRREAGAARGPRGSPPPGPGRSARSGRCSGRPG